MHDHVIRHRSAYWYDFQQYLNGAHAIYRHLGKTIKLTPDDVVVDIGCGTGTVLRTFKQIYPEASLHGIDPSPEMIGIAREKDASGAIDFKVGVAQELPFADRSIDCVISSLTTHHISTEGRTQMFREVRRVLKPGGRFFLTDFHEPETFLGRVALKLFLGRHAYIPELSSVSNRDLLTQEGFLIYSSVPQKPLGIAEHIEAKLA